MPETVAAEMKEKMYAYFNAQTPGTMGISVADIFRAFEALEAEIFSKMQ